MHGEEEGKVEEGMGAPAAGTAEEDGGWEAFYNRFKDDQRVRRELELDRGLREFLKSPEARDEDTAFRRLDEYSRARFGLDAERGDAWNADRKPFATASQYADALVGITRRGYEAVATDEWRAWTRASREERMRIAGVNPNKAAASDETPGAFATADAFAFQRVVPKTDAEIDAEIADYGARIEGQNFLGVMRAYDARFGFTPDERALVRAALRHGDGLPEEMAWDFERVLRADPERGRALKDLVDRTRRTERRWWRDNAVDPFVGGFERIRRGLEDAFGEFAGPMALEAQMRALVGGSADSGRWWWNDAERAEYARLKDLYAADARVRAYAAADPKRLVDNMCARRLALEAVPAEERRRARRERVILEDALSHKPTVAYGYASRTLAGVLSTLPYMAVTATPYAGFAANVLSQFETVRDGIILDGGDEDEAVGAQLLLAAGWAGIEKAQLGHLFGKPLTGLRRKAMLAKIYKASWEGGRLAKIGAYARQGAKEAVAATLAESMEEGLQGALEAGEMEWFAGRGGGHDGVATLAAALKGGAGDFVESLGTMGVLSLVGAGVKVGRVNRDARGAESLAEYAAAALRAKNVLRGTVMDPERPGADVPEAARRAVQEVWSIWRRHAEDGTGGVAALDEIRERYGLDEAQTRDVGDWLDLRDNLVEAARHADTDEEGRFVAGVAGGMFRIGAPGSHLDAQALYDVVLPGTKVEEVEIPDPSAAPAAPVAEAAPSAELAAAVEDVSSAQAEVDAATVGSARRGAERRLRRAKKRIEGIRAKAPAPEAAPKPTRKAQKVTLPTGESYILDIDASSPDIDSEGWAQSVEQAMREAFADPALGEDEKPSVDGRGLSLDAFRALPADRKADVAVTTGQYLSMTHAERESYCGNWDLGEGARTRILDETGRELLGADGVVTIKNGFRRFVHRGGNWELAHEHGHFIAAVASRHMTPGQIATMRRLFGDPTSENERWNEENANNQFAEWLRGKYDFRVFTPEERRARMNWFQRALDTIKHLFWLSGERPPAAPVEVTQRGRALDAAFNALRSGDFSGLDVYAGIDFAEDHAGKDGKDAAPDARRPASTASGEKAENPAPKPAAKGAERPLQRPESGGAPTASADFQAGYDAAVAAMNANPGAFADGQSVRTGGKMTVVTPDYSMEVEAEPMWTPLASLVESTDDREVQMRDRTRAASDEQTHSKTRPGVFYPLALFPGTVSDRGAPIVGGGNRIISGHGRKRMLDILAQEGRFGEYLDAVAAEAKKRGLTPPPDGMENPVLVLRVTGGLDRRADLVRFAELSNRSGLLERSGAEFAESDARKITDALLRLYAPDASGNLLAASNRPFMAAFLKAVGATGLTNADGTPTPEAALRVQRALMTAVFGNDEKVRSMVQSLLERSQELSLASLQNALMRSAGRLLAMKRQKGSFDIVADVREAAYQYIAWRVAQQKSPKLTLAEHLRQSDFFAAEVPPMQQALARLLDAERFGKVLEKYNDLVAQQAVDAQSTFGFFEAKTPLQLLGEAERALLADGETPVTPDPASPEAAAPEQTPPAVQAEAEPAPTPEAEPADPVEAAQAEIAPPEPETFVPVPAVRGTATLPGPGAEGVKAHQVNADGRPTTAVRTLPPGAWNLLRAPYDVRRPPKPSAQDRAGRGLGISAPPPATDSQGRYWGKVFPHFQGNKAEMADRTSQAIRKTMTKAERDHYSTVVDYFGGGGCWGLYHALTNFENARQLVVNEFDPDRLEKIRLLHEIDGQVADEAARIIKEPKTYARIRQLVGETSSPGTIASRVQSYLLEGKDEADAAGSMFVFGDEIRKVTDPRERAVLKAFVDCAQPMFATVKDEDGKPVEDPMAGIDKALDALREDGRKAKEAADAFKARGGSISYRSGDASAFDDAPSGHQVVAVCDPPYYLTQDYQQGTILGLDNVPDNWSYAATRDLLRQLVDRGDAIVYTDEAWWNKESYTPDRRERNGVSTFGKEQQTLLDIINTLDHFDVAGRVAGRQETLGIHHGHATDGKPEGGAGRADVRDDRADDARGGDDGARPSVRRVAGDLEGEGRAARGALPHRGREGRVAIAREVIVQDIASSVEEASPVSDPAAVDTLVRHSVRSVREDRMADYAKTVSRNAKAWLRRRAADLDKQMAAAGYTEKVWHGTEGKDFNVFKFSAESHGVPAAYFTYKRETAQNYAAIRGMDAAMDGDYGQINTRQFYVNPGKVLDYDEAKTPLDFDGVLKMLKKAYEDGYNAVRCHNILDDQGARLDENDENMTFLAPEDAPGNGEGDFITDTLIVLQQPGDNAAARIKAADPVTFLDELPIPPEMRGNAGFADVRFSVQMGSRDEQYRYGIGSSLLNGEGFVDLEKGDTYRAIEEAVRTEVGKEVTNKTLGITAKIGSNANANHIVSKMSAFGDEDSEAHKYAAKNILSLFEKAAIGIVHHDKKGTPNDYIRAFAPFHFAGRVELATITLRRDKGGNRLYTVEAVETGTGSSPRSSWRTTQGAQLPVSLDDRIAYYVGDVNRTQPAFIGRDAGIPFTPESLKLKIDIELEKLETLDKTNANRQPQEVEPRQVIVDGHGRMTDANGRPVARSSATRRRSVGLANVATALFAQQLLAGKEVSAEDADNLLRNIGLGALPAPALLARAKELAEANREKVQRLVRDNAPGLVAALAQNGLEAQFRDAIDGAVTGTAKSVDPSVGQRLQKAIQSKETRELMAAKGFDAAQMMAELPIDLPRGVLATADRVKTPEERAKLEEARKRREEERAAAEAEMTDEERLAAVDDQTYVPPSEESLALFKQLYDSAKFALEARQAEERRAAAEKAKRKAEGSQQDESGEAADAAGSVPSAQADADEFLPAETVQRIAPVFDSPELFAQFIVEWTAKHVVEKHPDIPSTAQMWKNPVAIRELKQTATGILRKLARDCLGSPSLNYARNFVDHQINELESDAETRTYKSVLRKVAYVYDAIHENALRLKRRELVNRLVNGYRAKNPETGKTETVPGIRQLAGVKGRFSAVKEEFQRAIDARTEVWARQLVPLLTMGEERLASEIAEMERRLAADPTADDYVPMDDDARREMADRLALARKYGGLVRRMPGEIADAADEILSNLNGKRQAFEQRRLEREERCRAVVEPIVKAMEAGGNGFRGEKWAVTKWIESMQGNIALEMQNLVRFCPDPELRRAALEAIDEVLVWISEGESRYLTALHEAQTELNEGLAACYGSAEKGIRHLTGERIPEDVAVRIFTQGGRRPTYGQLLQLYASAIQSDYRENAEKHGRTAQLPLMEQTLTDADKAFHAFAVEWHRRNRRALSDSVEAVTGLPVTSPDALYCRVCVKGDPEGIPAHVVAWSPVPAALNRRVRHGKDFDESAEFFSVLSRQCEVRAQAVGLSMTGILLRDTIGSREVRLAAERHVGRDDIARVMDHVRDILVQDADGAADHSMDPVNVARKWAARFGISGNVSSALAQPASIPVWANVTLGGKHIGLANVARYMATVGTKEAQDAVDELVADMGFKARYEMGWSEEVANVIKHPSRNAALRFIEKGYDKGMVLSHWTDRLCSLWIAQGFYRDATRHFLERGEAPEEAKRKARAITIAAVEATQQSGRVSALNALQRKKGVGGSVARAFFQFKTAQVLSNNFIIQSVREVAARPTDKAAWGQLVRSLFIASSLVPAYMAAKGALWAWLMGDEPPEEDPEKWPEWFRELCFEMVSGVTAPVFFAQQVVETPLKNLLHLRTYGRDSGMPAIDGAMRFVKTLSDVVVDAFDVEDALHWDKVLADLDRLVRQAAAPYRHGKRMYDNRWGEGAR